MSVKISWLIHHVTVKCINDTYHIVYIQRYTCLVCTSWWYLRKCLPPYLIKFILIHFTPFVSLDTFCKWHAHLWPVITGHRCALLFFLNWQKYFITHVTTNYDGTESVKRHYHGVIFKCVKILRRFLAKHLQNKWIFQT